MQGFNMGRYVPPDLEGTTSFNKASGKGHALGQRASKLASQGILTVRFEMPFPVWCSSCPKPTLIGQGVRFNAEKKRVGSYFSSPIFSFRMKHVVCSGWLEIRTDPKNTAYVVTEGGKAQDRGENKVREGDEGLVILTDAEREALRSNAFAKLEKTIEDREQLAHAKVRIKELHEQNEKRWENPYEQNRRLRKEFRIGRHAREEDAKVTDNLQDTMSLGIDLLPSTEEDARRAKLVDFVSAEHGVKHVLARPLFEKDAPRTQKAAANGKKRLKSEAAALETRESLVSELAGNTRLSQDPFLQDRNGQNNRVPPRIAGIKRRKVEDEIQCKEKPIVLEEGDKKGTGSSFGLVDYSDSE